MDAPDITISRRNLLISGAAATAATVPIPVAAQTPGGGTRRRRERVIRSERHDAHAAGRHAHDAARCAARTARPDRHQEGLRPGPVRRLHRARRRPAHQLVPDASPSCTRATKITTIEGLGTPDSAPPDAGGVRQARRLPVRLLHAGPDLLGGRHARRDQGRHPSHVSADLTAAAGSPTAEIRERMSGNICRCGAYPNIVAAIAEVAGGTGMKPFTYERASTPAEAAAAAAASRARSSSPAAPTCST